MRRSILGLAVLSACADPAVLRVELEVREPGLGAVQITAVREPEGARATVLSCLLPAGEEAGGPLVLGLVLHFVIDVLHDLTDVVIILTQFGGILDHLAVLRADIV